MSLPDRLSSRSRACASAGVAIVLLLVSSCSGPAGDATTVVGDVELDMFRPDGSTASATGPLLEAGRSYALAIQGTYSVWTSEWDGGACKGIPDSAPMFPSPGGTNGPAGADPEYRFAIAEGSSLCSSEDVPDESNSVEWSVDGGSTFVHTDPVPAVTAPNSDHTYVYEVVGEGSPIIFQREDGTSSDNYGILKITVRTR